MKDKKVIIGILSLFVLALVILLVLVLKKPTFEVKFVSDNEVLETIKVKKNDRVSRPKEPTKEGYSFIDWFLDGNVYNFDSRVTKDITLTAKWSSNMNSEDKEMLVVSFDTGNGSFLSPIKVEKNGTIDKPSDPTKEGYNFISWQLDGKDFDFKTKISKNITLTAKWEKKETAKPSDNNVTIYTVKFDSNGGSNVDSQKVKASDTAKKPANPTREGYIFVEWQLNGNAYNFNLKVTKNITLKAVWQQKTIDVSSVSISNDSLNLKINEQKRLTATVNPDNATNKNTKWTSNNTNVATVDENGTVTAVGEGTATITVTAGDKTATCTITVEKNIIYSVEWVKVVESNIGQYTLYIKDSDGNYVSGKVEITTINDKVSVIDVPIEGVIYIKSAIKDVKIKSVN